MIILVVIVSISIFSPSEKSGTSSPPKKEIELNSQIRFTGTQFKIINKNNFNWTNVKLEINPGTFRSGYTYRVSIMIPNYEYVIGAMQFTKGDGTRFNPLTIKPKEIFIACDTPEGRAYYSGGWK